MSQKIYSGYDSHKKLRTILNKYAPKKIFLVTGKTSYSLSGAKRLLDQTVSKYNFIRFFDFQVNPSLKDIKKGIDVFKKEKCDLILGAGGGSVIDIAKAISILATQTGTFEKFITGTASLSTRQFPSIMIPTTAGTGSESTHFSVVYMDKIKYSLAHASLLPDVAILDPVFTINLPADLTAHTGMDALCHGIESFWSVNSTEESRAYSKQAIEMVMSNIVKCVHSPDKKTRMNMLMASNLAGRAINIAKTTAAHAISYPLTSCFNIPHGHAAALTIANLIEFNSNVSLNDIQDDRGIEFAKKIISELVNILGARNPVEAKKLITKILMKINIKTQLSVTGMSKKDAELIIEKAVNPERIRNNPRILSKKDIRFLIRKIL
jgi:alcohol dehydrogenase class IV